MATHAIYHVEGMTCGHCVHAVVTELNAIEGVTDVVVSLVPGATSTVDVRSNEPLAPEVVEAAIGAAGYALTDSG
jgi:copper chaperone CopZ